MNRLRFVAAALGLAAASMATVGTASASVQPHIIGGGTVESAPWGAQIYWDDVPDFGGFACSGTIIAPEWVLTAQHCLNEPGMNVRVGNINLGEGTAADVDRQEASPNGDIALLHLTTPVETTYMQLGTGDPAAGATNQIYGWGRTEGDSPPASQLKTANVNVTGGSFDAYFGPAIASQGVDGAAWKGDSGGPQLADGVQVGVCSTGLNDGTNPQGSQNYASVAASRDWIQTTAGV